MKISKNSGVKIRVCSIIGYFFEFRGLLRHATAIENELQKCGLTTALIETLNEVNVYARRRAIAALGEYLFYAAT